jgi:hypothetical protein
MLHNLRFFSLQNAVYFIMLPCLVPILIHILNTGCAKIKKKFSRQRVNRAVLEFFFSSNLTFIFVKTFQQVALLQPCVDLAAETVCFE